MTTLAAYSLKGGVGKTTSAVNPIAAAAYTRSIRRSPAPTAKRAIVLVV